MSKKKSKRKPRARKVSKKKRGRKKKTMPRTSRSQRIYRQCMLCGGPGEQKYGTGDNSWCPHCRQTGHVCYLEGKLPDPPMYGAWLEEQEELARAVESSASRTTSRTASGAGPRLTPSAPKTGEPQVPILSSGTYHCRGCGTPLDLRST